MVLLSRVDEQMAQLASRRKALLDELRAVQNQINDEFQRLIESEKDLAARMASVPPRIDAPAAPAIATNGHVQPFTTQRLDEPALT
jgi:hypothetical protein